MKKTVFSCVSLMAALCAPVGAQDSSAMRQLKDNGAALADSPVAGRTVEASLSASAAERAACRIEMIRNLQQRLFKFQDRRIELAGKKAAAHTRANGKHHKEAEGDWVDYFAADAQLQLINKEIPEIQRQIDELSR